MIKKVSWSDKYMLAISEFISTTDIMKLRSCGRDKALQIRKEALVYCLNNNIDFYGTSIPTEAVLKVTNKDIKFYYDKMLMERKEFNFL